MNEEKIKELEELISNLRRTKTAYGAYDIHIGEAVAFLIVYLDRLKNETV